jgi:hypothetical protein
MQKPFLLAVFAALCTGLSAQIYKGTIGSYPVYMNFDYATENGDIGGGYFYESKTAMIAINGQMFGDELILKTEPMSDEDVEIFKLSRVGIHLNGTWKYHGRQLNVSLEEVDPSTVQLYGPSNALLWKEGFTPFESIRMSFAEFIPMDSVTQLKNGIELSWYKEKHWDLELFRITKGLPGATMQWINKELEAIQTESFLHYGNCVDMGNGAEYFASVNDYFIDADFLSLEVIHSWSCGGAHPDFGSHQVNLDLKNRRALTSEDLVQFPGVLLKTEDNFTEWAEYRAEFGTRINNYIKALYPGHMPPPGVPVEELEECNYNDPSVWEFSEVRITPDGLKVGAYFPRYARSCDDPEWSYIPYDVIEEFINPAYREQLMKLAK